MNFSSLSILGLRIGGVLLLCLTLSSIASAQPPPPEDPENWGENLLKDDPLVGKEEVTLAELQAALLDPKRRETVVERHFARAAINVAEQKRFLKSALMNDSELVQHQALQQLGELGLLDEVVAEVVLEIAQNGDEEQKHAALIALQDFNWDKLEAPPWYRELVQKTLASENAQEREAAGKQILFWGEADLPQFLRQFSSKDSLQRRQAAIALSHLLSPRGASTPIGASGAPSTAAPQYPTIPKARVVTATGPQTERQLEKQKTRVVRVYFGTNRELLINRPDQFVRLAIGLLAIFVGVMVPVERIRRRKIPTEPLRRRQTAWITFWCLMIGVGVGIWGVGTANDAWYLYRSHRVGPEFADRRSSEQHVYYGYCDVSIPPSHEVGLVEQPIVGAEDEGQHVVIERSALLDDQKFFETVRKSVAAGPRQETFIFVLGYNVTFDQAARRTAQIHYDLQFQGVPLFYSWPSRANMRLYASDRNEIGYSVQHIQQFLIDVKRRSRPGRIHVVAHSMGAEGVARAIAALGDEGKIFDQVILAAPDIDADVFREQLAPKLAQGSQRTTLYCSRNDWALHASYAFNDSPRVGDSSYGVTVREDMDTIDASEIDTDLIGHSYYGDCLPILRDVRLMIEQNLGPDQRELERLELPNNLAYWLFHHPR